MDEKKLLELLRQDAESLTPPESLTPDAVEALLNDTARQQAPEPMSPPGSPRKPRILRFIAHYGSLAAVFVLGLTVLWQAERIAKLEGTPAPALQNKQTEQEAVTDSTELPEETAQDAVEGAAEDASPDAAAEPLPEALDYADSYQQVYERLCGVFGANVMNGRNVFGEEGIVYDVASKEIATMDFAETQAAYGTDSGMASLSSDYSKTNLQEFGVDEGDIVKTDGTWIYILRSDLSVSIVRADDGAPELISTVSADLSGLSHASVRELYLDGDTLNLIADGTQTLLETEAEDVYYPSTKQMTVLTTWDITDRSHPVLTGTLNQEGYYADSRKVGNYLYLFTGYTPSLADTWEASTLAPRINGEQIPADHVYLPELPASQDYLVIASVDLTAPSVPLDEKVLISGASNFYVSPENIYIANETYLSGDTVTELTKFHYSDGQITGIAAGSVPGRLNNSFSMNEYEDHLRVVSTYYDKDWNEWNALYVLDGSLRQLSVIDDLAKGETIRSARFFGDTGYFVTFRRTDPLFSVDLSDPSDPQILGELKVTGFSSYLHFYGEDRLLGIGYEADETTGTTTGLKLSMFDISDPSNVTELSRTIIPGITWCPAIEDYKSILVDPDKNLIGFYCNERYFVYSYDADNGFTRRLLCDFYSDDFFAADSQSSADSSAFASTAVNTILSSVDYDNMRGLYIRDTFFLAGDGFVISYDMNHGFAKKDLLFFD